MRKADVKIGGCYVAKVSDREVPVRVLAASPYGGWIGRNEKTGRELRIRTAARLRRPCKPLGMVEAVREMRRRGATFQEAKARYLAGEVIAQEVL